MILLTPSLSLPSVFFRVGLASPETVTRFADVDDQKRDVSLDAPNTWRTAEAYYQGSEFSFPLLACAESTLTDVALAADVGAGAGAGSEDLMGQPEQPKPHPQARSLIMAQSHPPADGVPGEALAQRTTGSELTSAYDPNPERADVQSDRGDADTRHVDGQLHPPELVQTELQPEPLTVVTPKKAVPDREPSMVHILPPPPQRTPSEVRPPTDLRTVPPAYPMVSSYEPRSYADSAEAVRRRAEIRAEERRRRIEARKWLGYSPLRPPVGATPFMGSDSRRPAVIIVPIVVYDRD
ncbi:MAG: hypothetical protein H8E44_18475 [Planctomycetes bacterium]|nr:hypothetical protein [Planctomycetota bacterium]